MAFSNRWITADGTFQNDPITIRYRDGVEDEKGSGQYPHCIQIVWEASDVDADTGYPNQAELIKIDAFNQKLMQAIESKPCGLLVMVLTSQGINQWILYATSNEEVTLALDSIPTDTGLYPIEVSSEEDADWLVFTQLRDAIKTQ
ncbi:DUF695 domain-containing protein [Bermanella marisrubri]|uniref:DUF695 domain-containing protein n=1 Tax=Bermanella marisrubri TaxID=207949 RepID=Q1N632_9GAMM|nr:DUF695 domain-containing protein [Bermanella marisrubri]EAT13760.1 hypothetical protein RED65_10219 [Oceanobacter sp. RED65] [Bermanella marisrubri]QIZ84533.1 DUF695 domain-containing protein [Bermanella marisrubri]